MRVANDTSYGLGSAVFTSDLERGQRIAEQELDAGMSSVNDFVRSDPRLPFGGVKMSGVGRECGVYGLKVWKLELLLCPDVVTIERRPLPT